MSIVSVRNDTLGKVSVINAFAPLAPVITSYNILVSGVIADDTAVDTAGGQTIQVNGTGFISGALITLGGSGVTTAYVNANTLTFTAPAKTAATYAIYVLNPDGGTAIFIPGVVYSGTPAWTTTAISPATVYETDNITTTALVTTGGDAPIVYSLASGALPVGAVLNASTGVITGTAPAVGSNTTYTFTIKATDQQLQDSTSTSFSLTINTDVVTWSSPAAASTVTLPQNAASTTALVASSAAGKAITYTSTALPAGLSISGATVTGTPTAVATTAVTFTATAATTGKTTTAVINWTISVAADTYFRNTTLLLSGAAATETFVADASANNFAVTIVGDTKPNNFNPYTPGYYSNYFDGSGDYLTVPANAAFAFGTGDFTIEGWVYYTTKTNSGIFQISTTLFAEQTGIGLGLDASNNWMIYYGNGSGAGPGTSPNLATWYHFAVVRSSGTTKLYINGVVTSTSVADTFNYTGSQLGVGGIYSIGYLTTGYISNFRIIKGVAVYTGNFTPSTTPLTAITNTSLLTCQSNRFIDNSANAFAVTRFGGITVNSFTPFVPNTQYATQGSTYFDGTGDYLTAPSNSAFGFGNSNYTIELWVYPTSSASSLSMISKGNASSLGADFWSIEFSNTSGGFSFFCGAYNGGSVIVIGTAPLNTWTHIAVVRNSLIHTLYVNGVSVSSATAGADYTVTSAGNLYIGTGSYAPASRTITGYISNARIVKGVAVYTANFTPPATPLSATQSAGTNIAAITGSATSLLTLQTNQPASNSMFLDSSTNAFPVTRAGNTSAGTFTPYGANWSNYFGIKTDYISIPVTAALTTFTGDFTFECWVNPTDTSISVNWGIWDSRQSGSTANPMIFTLQNLASPVTGQWRLGYYNGTQNFGTGIVLANQWTHVAFVRSGSTLTYYVNGVAGGTTTVSGTQTGNSSSVVYIGSKDSNIGGYGTVGYISNFRIVNGTAVYTGATVTVPTAPLTAIANTVLLTCQSNRSVDNSANAFVLTLGSATVSAQRFSPFAPQTQTAITNSAYFDGTGDYLTAPSNAAFGFDTGDFTIEAWIYRTDTGVQRGIVDSTAGSGGRILFFLTANNVLNLFDGYSVWLNSAITVPANQWVHVAAVRISGTTKLYINGAQQASSSDVRNYGAAVTHIGRQVGTTTNDFMGYISNVRMVKGVGVYTGNFTVPTAPLTATQAAGTNIAAITGTQTSLLTCQSPTFTDNSTNAFAITAFDGAKPRTLNPFGFTNASAAYSAATYGGSAYFDGTTDYLSVPDNAAFTMDARSFTLEAWVYLTTSGVSRVIIGTCDASGTQASMAYTLGVNASNNAQFGVGYAGVVYYTTNTATIPTNQWVHIAGVRNGAYTYTYVNGIQSTTNTNMAALAITDSSQVIGIGRNGAYNGEYLTGYISDARIVSGTAVYTSNFVPPTAPVTAITNTSLLLNMTSSGVYDSASMSNLETVADAKILSTHTPYAGSFYSTYHTANTASLSAGNNVKFAFPGEFTVEGWFNWSTLPVAGQAIGVMAAGGFNITYGSGSISFNNYGSSSIATATYTFVVGVWYHIAMTRNASNTCTVWINGVSSATANSAASFVQGTWAMYGGSNNGGAGNISNLRVVKGVAVYTAAFTVPTAPLTATQSANTNGNPSVAISGSQTSLLTCQSNRFVDNSTYAAAITRNGTTSVQSFNPFQRNSAATMYFDGTGDYLVAPYNPAYNFGTGDFTIEFWVNTTSTAAYLTALRLGNTWTTGSWSFYLNDVNGSGVPSWWSFTLNTALSTSGVTINDGAWHHIALVRNSTTMTMYIDGTSRGTLAVSTSSVGDTTTQLWIARDASNVRELAGYINDLRITKGVARYTGTFVPPTSAFIAV